MDREVRHPKVYRPHVAKRISAPKKKTKLVTFFI